METKHLTYFKVENFKRFDSLEVNDIGQFNLVVGDNNVGKTSFLEALLFDEANYENFLINLEFALQNREIYIENYKINFIDFYLKNVAKSLNFNFGFAQHKNDNKLVLIKKRRFELTEGEMHTITVQLKLSDSPYLMQFTNNESVELKIVELQDKRRKMDYNFPYLGSKIYYDEEVYDFLSTISKSNKKLENFKLDLKYFIPNLINVEVSGSVINEDLSVIIRESDSDAPRQLAQYGDGFIKLFRFLLKLEFCENNRLMIDEIDTGIHYSRMKDFLKKVIQTAKNKNVQIFATTHSKECIEYYKQALEELGYEDDGRVIKIADTKSGIKSFTFNFEQFDNALFAGSEIR